MRNIPLPFDWHSVIPILETRGVKLNLKYLKKYLPKSKLEKNGLSKLEKKRPKQTWKKPPTQTWKHYWKLNTTKAGLSQSSTTIRTSNLYSTGQQATGDRQQSIGPLEFSFVLVVDFVVRFIHCICYCRQISMQVFLRIDKHIFHGQQGGLLGW